jgi:DNA-binding transcriptional ArsR family regulator
MAWSLLQQAARRAAPGRALFLQNSNYCKMGGPDCRGKVMKDMIHPEVDEIRLERVLYALSDELRLSIVRQLAEETVASCAALDRGRPKSTMSHHFRVLREAGVVRTRHEGVTHMNELRREELDRRFPGLLSAVLAARG